VQTASLIATVFGIGRLKPGPGTWGSAAGLVLAYPITGVAGSVGLLAGFLAVTAAGIWASDRYAAQAGASDPSEVVIDEVAGLWLTLFFAPFTILDWVIAFGLFRLFDIWKPWPISWADRRIKGGLGIMLDDLLAGLCAALAHFVLRLTLVG
jgi:phosphatidylglycerophosphatase A